MRESKRESKDTLATLILFSFNQEEYIEEAVKSVLVQTYQRLEIIISDDCSDDGTFRIIERLANEYTGPHSIRINRNGKNEGIGKHVSKVMLMAKGDLIVLAAGDDVSLPRRVETLVQEWHRVDCPAGIASDVVLIDEGGREVGTRKGFCCDTGLEQQGRCSIASLKVYQANPGFCLLGCAAAWTPDVLKVFGYLSDDVMNEDAAFSLRALILGGVASVNTQLVKYRVHESNVWAKKKRGKLKTINERLAYEGLLSKKAGYRASLCRLGLSDVKLAQSEGFVTSAQFEGITEILELEYEKAEVAHSWWSYSLTAKLRRLSKLSGGYGTKVLKLLPLTAFARLKVLLS